MQSKAFGDNNKAYLPTINFKTTKLNDVANDALTYTKCYDDQSSKNAPIFDSFSHCILGKPANYDRKTLRIEPGVYPNVCCIAKGAFQNYKLLRKIVIANGNLTICENAFSGCTGIETVLVTASTDNITYKTNAFAGAGHDAANIGSDKSST